MVPCRRAVGAFAVQAGTGWPPLLIVAFFATNSLEAILGAGAFRWLAGTPPRIDSLRHMTLFIGVVAVGAPLLSSFPDAAVVNWFQGEPFALVVRRRVASNVMTTLALLPAMLVLWLHLPRWIRHTHPRRWLEAGALTAALVTQRSLPSRPWSCVSASCRSPCTPRSCSCFRSCCGLRSGSGLPARACPCW